jgi:DNA-binding transcriptional LysR family regulator
MSPCIGRSPALSEQVRSNVRLFSETDAQTLDVYFVYAEEMRTVARVQVFRDFLVAKAQRWSY